MRILFVDDEANVLSGLRRMLRTKRNEWDMEFHEGGLDAIKSLNQLPADVVVSDMRMPGMDGVKLLSEIKAKHPECIRIALSGQTDAHMIYRCVEHAHQFIAKPCDAETLTETVERAFALRNLMADETLASLVSNLSSLPSLPEQYRLIMDELQTEDPSLKKIGRIIESDLAMTVKILQLVNSAFFGLAQHVSSPSQAAMFLGVDTLKTLVATTGVFSQFDEKAIAALNLQALWPTSMQIGVVAREITMQATTKDTILADYAYMGGMLADVGKIVLACNMPDELAAAQDLSKTGDQLDWQAELSVMGLSHMDVGAYLVGLWGLPNPIVEAVAFHHRPAESVGSQFSALTAVHVASALVLADDTTKAELDYEYIETLGLTESIEEWRNLYEGQDHD